MLTRRGWSFVGAGVALCLGSRLLGLVQVEVLGVAAIALVVAAYTWVRLRTPQLVAHRDLKERLQVGVDGRVDLTVRAAARRTATLAVSDSFDRGRRAARFLLSPLAPGEEARAAYRFPTDRRGRFEVGPLRTTLHDPFGLVSVTRRVLGSEDVVVYPRVHDVTPPPEIGGLDLDRDHPRVRARVEPTGEFMTLREYAPGDDLRHVHWRSTARRGQMMMRQNETRRRAPVLLVLDVRPGAHDHASFERAVEACAAIATALDRAGRPFDVVWSTGVVVGAPGRRHLASVMDELAIVQTHGADRWLLTLSRRRSSACVAICGHLDVDDAGALGMLVRDGGTCISVDTSSKPSTLVPRARRYRLVSLHDPGTRPFTQLWNEAMLRWQRSNSGSSPSHARA